MVSAPAHVDDEPHGEGLLFRLPSGGGVGAGGGRFFLLLGTRAQEGGEGKDVEAEHHEASIYQMPALSRSA
ncbi:hypothetical protein MVI01_24770 [Myxococcus virescens]|uniref:Uncharacterized protein n=1 Tax=Myxococcus virescens TaxID=83456 RepID=A0A511HAX7_9BACT|nr:hypothetical protein MVI01_24770 [Myxococcus virescens]